MIQSAAEESSYVNLAEGQVEIEVDFLYAKTSADYEFSAYIQNTVDAAPIYIGVVLSARSTTGFTAKLSAAPDSANYVLRWHVKV